MCIDVMRIIVVVLQLMHINAQNSPIIRFESGKYENDEGASSSATVLFVRVHILTVNNKI